MSNFPEWVLGGVTETKITTVGACFPGVHECVFHIFFEKFIFAKNITFYGTNYVIFVIFQKSRGRGSVPDFWKFRKIFKNFEKFSKIFKNFQNGRVRLRFVPETAKMGIFLEIVFHAKMDSVRTREMGCKVVIFVSQRPPKMATFFFKKGPFLSPKT